MGCEHELRSAESLPPCARERLCRHRFRSDQLTRVDPGRAHAARRAFPCLVPAAAGGARDPEPLPEPAGSGAPLLKEKASPMQPPPRRAHRRAGHRAQASAIGFLVPLLLPPG